MDNRLIEKIEAYQHGLNLVNEMKPVTYHQKGKQHKQLGLVSQEIQALEPKTVIQTSTGLVINYDAVIPILINAIKELNQEVNDLKAKKKK